MLGAEELCVLGAEELCWQALKKEDPKAWEATVHAELNKLQLKRDQRKRAKQEANDRYYSALFHCVNDSIIALIAPSATGHVDTV